MIYVRHVQWSPSVAGACTIMYIPLKKTHLAGPERSRQGLTNVAKNGSLMLNSTEVWGKGWWNTTKFDEENDFCNHGFLIEKGILMRIRIKEDCPASPPPPPRSSLGIICRKYCPFFIYPYWMLKSLVRFLVRYSDAGAFLNYL